MTLRQRLNYWRRIFFVYLVPTKSYLSFWHEVPAMHPELSADKLGPYYMTFADKARYDGPKDEKGVILFDYYANIGRQYNPVAIAQYGLGNYNEFLKTGEQEYLERAVEQGDWLVDNLKPNKKGVLVWQHDFEWHYKQVLPSGWYSALSQGSGISLLARLYETTREEKYREAAREAFVAMTISMAEGGVKFTDSEDNVWLEEYMVEPPTHILNGFIWAIWGVWDYYLLTEEREARELFTACLLTLQTNLPKYDAGFWSLYDLSKQAMRMMASPFYHSLHVAQLEATAKLTGISDFAKYENKFRSYRANAWRRWLAWIYKVIFKIFYF